VLPQAAGIQAQNGIPVSAGCESTLSGRGRFQRRNARITSLLHGHGLLFQARAYRFIADCRVGHEHRMVYKSTETRPRPLPPTPALPDSASAYAPPASAINGTGHPAFIVAPSTGAAGHSTGKSGPGPSNPGHRITSDIAGNTACV
jgi:hypothetical protein